MNSRHPTTTIHWLTVNPTALHLAFDTDEGPPRVTVTKGIDGEHIALPNTEATRALNKAMLTASLILTSAYIHHQEATEGVVGEVEG